MASEHQYRSRRSIRLQGYDYSWPGWYYVTVCVRDRQCVLGKVIADKIGLNQFGEVTQKCWEWLPRQYSYVELDDFVIMPNHIHGIIIINGLPRRGGSRTAPTEAKPKSLGRLIGAFKTTSTKEINTIRRTPGGVFWQRGYYEHIIRNDRDLYNIRQYISNNPLQWAIDVENQECSALSSGYT